MSTREAVEDLFMASIQDLHRQAVPAMYLRHIGPYNGEINRIEEIEDIARLLRGRSPAVLVTASGANIATKGMNRRRFDRILDLEVFIISNHLRDRESRHRRDQISEVVVTADPGIYQIIDDIQERVTGFKLDPCYSSTQPVAEERIFEGDSMTIWRLTYQVEVPMNQRPHEADTWENPPINLSLICTTGLFDGEVLDECEEPRVAAESYVSGDA